MKVTDLVLDAIGHTPLIKLKAASEATGCAIYGKAEFINPGGSVKDRAALAIVRTPWKQARCSPEEPSSRARQAIPASAWRWSPMRSAFAR